MTPFEAEKLTIAAQGRLAAHRNLLRDTVGSTLEVNWASLEVEAMARGAGRSDGYAPRAQSCQVNFKRAGTHFDALRRAYDAGEAESAAYYIGSALYFDRLQGQYRGVCTTNDEAVHLITETGILVVDSEFPNISILPTLKEVRCANSRGSCREISLTAKERADLYDSLLHQICLRTILLVYRIDTKNLVKSVAFNGWAKFINPATGEDATACVMTVHIEKEKFLRLNLARVNPKACFRALRGISGIALHEITPVAPMLQMSRKDARFVEGMEVASNLRQGTNLAAIGWADFEHLIRELFEKEFARAGGEVRVTQASRDGGVDAVVFDPDPIRGGKIVIQAKRYTNTVEASAVRDLYGTVQHEGAMKGILVTTSSFGPDAYSFAKDKPLTLLDGSNLLHLLGKHGHRVYIDLAEAKKLNPTPLARTISAESKVS